MSVLRAMIANACVNNTEYARPMASTTAVTNSGERRRVRPRKPLRNDRSLKRIKMPASLNAPMGSASGAAAVTVSPASIR